MLNFSRFKSVPTAPPGARLLLLFRLFFSPDIHLCFSSDWPINLCTQTSRSCVIWKLKMPSENKHAWVVSLDTLWTVGNSMQYAQLLQTLWAFKPPTLAFRWIFPSSYIQTLFWLRSTLTPLNSGLQVRWLLPLRHRPPPHRPPAHWQQQSCWLWPTLQCHHHPPLHRTPGYRWSAGDRMNQQRATALST